VGPNPTDRGKNGVKRSLLVEKDGGPLAIVVAGANVPDAHLLAATIEAIVLERPEPEEDYPQHLCLDRGYDSDNEVGWCPAPVCPGLTRATTDRCVRSLSCRPVGGHLPTRSVGAAWPDRSSCERHSSLSRPPTRPVVSSASGGQG
jgi:hypothetical protein